MADGKLATRVQAGDGMFYRLVLLKVVGTYDDRPQVGGMEVPAEMLFVDDDDAVEIAEGDRFVTAYVPEVVFGPSPAKMEVEQL